MRAANVVQQLCNNFEVLSFIVSFIASFIAVVISPLVCASDVIVAPGAICTRSLDLTVAPRSHYGDA